MATASTDGDARPRVTMNSRAGIPFGICAGVALLTILAPPYPDDIGELVTACVLLVAVAVAAMVLPWHRWPTWTHGLLPLGFFGVIALLRDSSAGTLSGLAATIVLPVLWIALYGTRTQMLLAGAATAFVFILPVVLVGPPHYPISDWRRGVIWASLACLIGPAVQAVVTRLHERDRQQTESLAVIAAAEQRWRTLLQELPDVAVLSVDADLRYEFMVGGGAVRHGLKGWLGKTVQETAGAQNVQDLEFVYREALAGRRAAAELFSTSDRLPHEVVAVPFDQPDGTHALVVARDISAAQHREAAIRTHQESVELLVEAAPTGICVTDLDGNVRRVNRALTDLLGVTAAHARTSTLTELGLGAGLINDRRAHNREGGAADEPMARRTRTVHLTLADGAALDLSVQSVLLCDAHGHPESVLVHVNDISASTRVEQHLAYLASHDPLTGLANRRKLGEDLNAHLSRCERYGPAGAVIVLDLDSFKNVNDTLGHDMGDSILVAVARLVGSLVRDSDTVARLGGDEFAILLPRAERPDAIAVASRIVSAIRDDQTFTPSGVTPVRASVGIVVIERPGVSALDLLALADLAMYNAKDAGRDRWAVLEADSYQALQSRSGSQAALEGSDGQTLTD